MLLYKISIPLFIFVKVTKIEINVSGILDNIYGNRLCLAVRVTQKSYDNRAGSVRRILISIGNNSKGVVGTVIVDSEPTVG